MHIGNRQIVQTPSKKSHVAKADVKPYDLVRGGEVVGALHACDSHIYEFWDALGEDEPAREKSFKESNVPMLRWLSTVGDADWSRKDEKGRPGLKDNDFTAFYVRATQSMVNRNFWDLINHPYLQFRLMCNVGLGMKANHQWIDPPKKKASSGKIHDLLRIKYPSVSSEEVAMWIKMNEEADVKDYCRNLGMDDVEIKEYVESFRKSKKVAE